MMLHGGEHCCCERLDQVQRMIFLSVGWWWTTKKAIRVNGESHGQHAALYTRAKVYVFLGDYQFRISLDDAGQENGKMRRIKNPTQVYYTQAYLPREIQANQGGPATNGSSSKSSITKCGKSKFKDASSHDPSVSPIPFRNLCIPRESVLALKELNCYSWVLSRTVRLVLGNKYIVSTDDK